MKFIKNLVYLNFSPLIGLLQGIWGFPKVLLKGFLEELFK
jgi:hypothetical protein